MENNCKKYYTAGEFAERAGVTIRTIRYYDSRGILKPSSYSEAGYRLYCEKDFGKLQKILTLKYLGFSLNDIEEVVNEDIDKDGLKESLRTQKELMEKKISHMKAVLKVIKETEEVVDVEKDFNWEDVIKIIDTINLDKETINQYINSQNLKSRINIHDKFSTNKYGWHKWVMDKMNLKPNMRILEIGCGDGTLWKKNVDRIPGNSIIYLSDISEGMIEDAKRNLSDVKFDFIYSIIDGENIPYEDNYFDVVIANHVLFHMKNRKRALCEIRRVLKDGGSFYATTIGNDHMKELHELCSEYDKRIDFSSKVFQDAFGIETGEKQLKEFFNKVSIERYDDSLIVTESKPLIDYLYSTIGNAQELLEGRKEDFKKFVEEKIKSNNGILINKYSGMFIAK